MLSLLRISSVLSPNDYLVLSPNCFLKHLEESYVYNIETDELYETNEEAFDFLQLCDGSRQVRDLRFERPFVSWCLEEGILTLTQERVERKFLLEKASQPSLRYLELQVTARCNFKCRHCYLGTAKPRDLPFEQIMGILQEFEQMQGLRLIISGGEPLLHPHFWTINDTLPHFGFRSILLTNGALIDNETAPRLKVHEIQVSLDGIGDSHDYLRGRGSFARAMSAISELRLLGKDVSVATMVHAKNLEDFPKLEILVKEMGIKEWNVDVPCAIGNLTKHRELQVPYSKAALFLQYSFGGGLYTSSPGYACGAHLCTVTPDGKVAKCGFFSDKPVGDVKAGLRNCWKRMKHIKIEELECQCQYKEECRGGCRFRALLEKDIYAPDPVQCYLRGVCKAG
jgi:radical SAM protein with 4Fe4S-binding SPASM domain